MAGSNKQAIGSSAVPCCLELRAHNIINIIMAANFETTASTSGTHFRSSNNKQGASNSKNGMTAWLGMLLMSETLLVASSSFSCARAGCALLS